MILLVHILALWFGTSVAVAAWISAALRRRPPEQPQPWACPDSVPGLFAELEGSR